MLDIRRMIGLLMVLSFGCGEEEKATPSADYVSAFYTGVFALEVGAFDRADASLSRALTMEPDEPAAWANRGVLRLRRGDYDGAAKDLKTARSLMPESGDIAMLQGLVERSRGQSDAAIAFFEEAAQQQGLVKAQYALMKEVERRGGAGSEEEVWAQLEVLVRQVPDNPALWVERARQAGKRDEEEALRASVEKLGEWAEGWPDAAQVQLRSLQGEMEGGSEAALQAMFLHNVLLRDPVYRRALDALIVPAERLGDPVVEFLKFSMPQAMPAPADLNMRFEPEPVAGLEGSDWQVLKPFWSKEEVEVVAASASQVRGTEGSALDFPDVSGMDGVLTVDWNNDFALDLALVGAEGFRLFRRTEDGGVGDVTDSIGLDEEEIAGVWGADVEMDGGCRFRIGTFYGTTSRVAKQWGWFVCGARTFR